VGTCVPVQIPTSLVESCNAFMPGELQQRVAACSRCGRGEW